MVHLPSLTHRYVHIFQFTIYHSNIPSIGPQLQLAFLVLVVVVGKQRKETADRLHRLSSALTDLLLLQTQQQYPVKRLEARLQLRLFFRPALLSQLYDKRQRFEVCRIIKGVFRGSQ